MNSPINTFVPTHIPSHLVVDFDFLHLDSESADPFAHFTRLLSRGIPPIFWSPRNGGHWVFCRHEQIFEGFSDWEHFTSSPQGIPNRPGGPAKLIPNELDPPEHERVRNVLAPLFSPARVAAMKSDIRARSAKLIDNFASLGRCDYMTDFAGYLPTGIFLDLIGLPIDRLPQFMVWEDLAMRSTDPVEKKRGSDSIYNYLNNFVNEKRVNLGDDVASALLRYRDNEGKPLMQEEVVAACHLLYLAGLDTVMNTLGFTYRHLANNLKVRQTIRTHPENLPAAVDEFTRVFGTPALARRVRNDMVYQGVEMKAGEPVLLPTMLANCDNEVYPNAETLDLSREPRKVLTFGAGAHRCLGVHLAKTEMMIALEEWFKRIPDFTLDPEQQITYLTGHTIGIRNLPLVWKV